MTNKNAKAFTQENNLKCRAFVFWLTETPSSHFIPVSLGTRQDYKASQPDVGLSCHCTYLRGFLGFSPQPPSLPPFRDEPHIWPRLCSTSAPQPSWPEETPNIPTTSHCTLPLQRTSPSESQGHRLADATPMMLSCYSYPST